MEPKHQSYIEHTQMIIGFSEDDWEKMPSCGHGCKSNNKLCKGINICTEVGCKDGFGMIYCRDCFSKKVGRHSHSHQTLNDEIKELY